MSEMLTCCFVPHVCRLKCAAELAQVGNAGAREERPRDLLMVQCTIDCQHVFQMLQSTVEFWWKGGVTQLGTLGPSWDHSL